MAKEAIGSNATFTGPQQGLTIIGDYAYAYSGRIPSSGTSTVTLLDFATGKHTSDLMFSSDYSSNSGNDAVWKITFNGQRVSSYYHNGGLTEPTNRTPFQLIIPPNTHVLIEALNQTGSETIYFYARLTGKIIK